MNNTSTNQKLTFIFQNYRKPQDIDTLFQKDSDGIVTPNVGVEPSQGPLPANNVKTGAPPSGWVDYITKLPIVKYGLKPNKVNAEQSSSLPPVDDYTSEEKPISTNKQVKFQDLEVRETKSQLQPVLPTYPDP